MLLVTARVARTVRAIAPALVMLAIGVVAFPSTGTDDSYLGYWPAHTLATRGELVNVNGDRVEQASSLLWTLVLAAAAKIGRVDVEALGVPLSIAAGVAVIAAVGALARRIDPRAAGTARWLAALSYPCLFWSFSGMETSLVAALWAGCASFTTSLVLRPSRASLVGATLCLFGFLLARPEAPFVAALALGIVTACVLAASPRRPELSGASKRVAFLFVAGAAAAMAIALFRHAYFGAWLPQPVRAKVDVAAGGALHRVLDGLLYSVGYETVRGSRPPGWPNRVEVGLLVVSASFASALALARARRAPARQAAFVAGAFFLASLAFPVLVAGDWMGSWRFLVTPIPCGVALLALRIVRSPRQARRALLLGAIAFELFVLARSAAKPALAIPLWYRFPPESAAYPFFVRHNVPHLRDAAFFPHIDQEARSALAAKTPPVTILSGQAGYVLYHLGESLPGRIRFVDRVSLATRDLEDCPLVNGYATDVGFSIATTAPLFDPSSPVHSSCNVPVPDLVFDNGHRQLYDSMRRSGLYDVVFEEGTDMLPAGLDLPASRTNQYLGVRSELAQRGGRAGGP